jgi:hypothetical protein
VQRRMSGRRKRQRMENATATGTAVPENHRG